jgi:hypothetical protein
MYSFACCNCKTKKQQQKVDVSATKGESAWWDSLLVLFDISYSETKIEMDISWYKIFS